MKSALLCFTMVLVTVSPAHGGNDSPEGLQKAFLDAILAGDADAIANLYTVDAVNYPIEGMVAKGRDQIRGPWAPFLAANTVKEISIFDDDHEVTKDTAVAWGLWRMSFVPKAGGDAVTMEGRFMDMSRKTDGKWMYAVDHASVPPPPPAQ